MLQFKKELTNGWSNP